MEWKKIYTRYRTCNHMENDVPCKQTLCLILCLVATWDNAKYEYHSSNTFIHPIFFCCLLLPFFHFVVDFAVSIFLLFRSSHLNSAITFYLWHSVRSVAIFLCFFPFISRMWLQTLACHTNHTYSSPYPKWKHIKTDSKRVCICY